MWIMWITKKMWITQNVDNVDNFKKKSNWFTIIRAKKSYPHALWITCG